MWACLNGRVILEPEGHAFLFDAKLPNRLFDGIFKGFGRESPRWSRWNNGECPFRGEGLLGNFSVRSDALINGHA